ncbi:unnamed protein product [Meganyctiphanes norvegica]|uniref:Troponin T n=1 Tax=Meganyctiphanes norvegica TaxID=48144 RepID=A0AAV2Q058_MEGNR
MAGAEFLKNRTQRKATEVDEQLVEFINEWREQKKKEDDKLIQLKQKQTKRRILRAEEEKRLEEQKKEEEDRKLKAEQAKKLKEQDDKKKALEELEKKRHGAHAKKDANKKFAGKAGDKLSNVMAAKAEMGKSKEQLAEEKKIALSIRVKPLSGLETMDEEKLKAKAQEIWNLIVKQESDKYDLEVRMKRQEYDLKELKERQKQQLRARALKKGLDPEALLGKHPPKIQTASKFERRTDRRTYDDKKKLFEGGWELLCKEEFEKMWQEKYGEFKNRTIVRLPKWFGERIGKKQEGDPDTDDEEEEEPEPPPPPPPAPEPESESEEEEEEEEEEEAEEEAEA